MSISPPNRQSVWLFGLLLSLQLLSSGCGGRATPTAQPTVTSVPTLVTVQMRRGMSTGTAVARATATAIPRPRPTPQTGPAQLGPFTIPFSDEWQYVQVESDESPSAHSSGPIPVVNRELVADGELHQTDPSLLSSTLGMEDSQLIAWNTTAEDAGLVAYVLPRNGLSMPRYLDLLAQASAAEPSISIQQVTIDYTLHSDVPVGYLHYTLPPHAVTIDENASARSALMAVNGYQLIYFDQTATTVLLVNFVERSPLSLTTQSLADHELPAAFASLAGAITTGNEYDYLNQK